MSEFKIDQPEDKGERSTLWQRAQPKQERAVQQNEAIIAAAQDLLEQLPISQITTSSVAAKAAIPVGSVYRYFPNIHAIYGVIFDRMNRDFTQILETSFKSRASDWKDEIRLSVQSLSSLFENSPSYRAVFLLALTSPELAALREHWNEELTGHFATGWSEGDDGFSTRNFREVAVLVVELYNAIQPRIFREWHDANLRENLTTELILAIEAYLANYLE